ncbi:hypothetical protein FS749_006243 [Ceratobasidium sp. UAMH 11750]|nr:hypothetical protein FS749_006243 [Ceratobasidium sp. UAMH 11750]
MWCCSWATECITAASHAERQSWRRGEVGAQSPTLLPQGQLPILAFGYCAQQLRCPPRPPYPLVARRRRRQHPATVVISRGAVPVASWPRHAGAPSLRELRRNLSQATADPLAGSSPSTANPNTLAQSETAGDH